MVDKGNNEYRIMVDKGNTGYRIMVDKGNIGYRIMVDKGIKRPIVSTLLFNKEYKSSIHLVWTLQGGSL